MPYDKQVRLRIAQNPIRSWSQIDGNLWFRFIARGALGGQLSQQPQIEYGFCYDFNFRKSMFSHELQIQTCMFKM